MSSSITTRFPAARRRALPGIVAASVLVFCILGAGGPLASAQEVPTIFLYVNDLSDPGVLLQNEEDALTSLCYDIDDLSTAEVAILIVNTTQPLGIDAFAVETFEKNGIGKEGLDNGVLIVVSVDERQWRIEVGYGLEGILNDAKVGRIGDANLTPALLAGDYYVGLYDTTYELGTEIVDNYTPPSDQPAPRLWIFDWWALLVAIAIFLFLGAVTKGRAILFIPNLFRRAGFGGGRSGGGGAKRKF